MLYYNVGGIDEVKSIECSSISFVIFDKALEACSPNGRPFDDPATQQEDEAAFGFRQLDDLKFDAVFGCDVGSSLVGIILGRLLAQNYD